MRRVRSNGLGVCHSGNSSCTGAQLVPSVRPHAGWQGLPRRKATPTTTPQVAGPTDVWEHRLVPGPPPVHVGLSSSAGVKTRGGPANGHFASTLLHHSYRPNWRPGLAFLMLPRLETCRRPEPCINLHMRLWDGSLNMPDMLLLLAEFGFFLKADLRHRHRVIWRAKLHGPPEGLHPCDPRCGVLCPSMKPGTAAQFWAFFVPCLRLSELRLGRAQKSPVA